MEAQNPQIVGSSVKYRLQTQSLNFISERQSKKDFQEDGKCLSVRKCGGCCGDHPARSTTGDKMADSRSQRRSVGELTVSGRADREGDLA